MRASEVTGIRAADATDLASLEQILEQESLGFDLQHWQRQAHMPGCHTYVVEREAIFGLVTCGPAHLPDAGIGEVLGLWIASEFRRQGWARKLLVRGLGFLKRRGFHAAQAFVTANADSTKRLLLGLDFVPLGYEREVNSGDQTIRQSGYQVDLKDYF